jgi:SlyX protein
MNNLQSRIETLEVTVAYQAETLEQLNRTIADQWKVIDGLKRGVDVLADRLQEAESRAGLANPADKPPPHY